MAAAAAQRAGPRRRRRLANSQRTEPPPEEVEGRGSSGEFCAPPMRERGIAGVAREVRAAVSSAVAIEKAMTGIPHRLVSFAPDPFPVAISYTTRGTL